ncbi:MAG: hypothetical protein QOH15_446, partial [Gaiellales bacterium]|nr:hypothetical protein [Gaiellales bacterium]
MCGGSFCGVVSVVVVVGADEFVADAPIVWP